MSLQRLYENNFRCNAQNGFALMEAMIGLFILAIGLLGMASLQNQAIKSNNTAHLYTQANWLANSIIEKARVNRTALSDYAVNFGDSPSASTNCQTSNCDAGNMADWDVVQWRAEVADLLPQGRGEVQINGQDITVLVQFDDDTGDQDPAATTSTDPLLQIQVSSRI